MQITDTDVAIATRAHDILHIVYKVSLEDEEMRLLRHLIMRLKIMEGKEVCKCPIK